MNVSWRLLHRNDTDDNQWIHPIGSPPMKIADMDLSCFEWQEINLPFVQDGLDKEGL